MLYNKVFYQGREIENERLELTVKGSLYFLGHGLLLRNCTVVIKVSGRNLFLAGSRFENCTFEVKQELKNHQQWISASLKGCRFKGRFSGCDFGHWPEYGTEPWFQSGSIEDCDFSEARLDACRIMGSDPATLRFPKWPCFTFLDPVERAAELRSVKWPGRYGSVVVDELHTHPPGTRALTEHAPTVANRFDTTPEALRAVIEKLNGIAY